LREEQVSAQRLFEAIDAALSSDGNLLSLDERTTLEAELQLLKTTTSKELDSDLLRKAIDRAAKASDDFAEKRMNASIQKALKGKNVAEI